MAKRIGSLYLNPETINNIAEGGEATQSVGVYYSTQGVPCTAFIQTNKDGSFARTDKGEYCLHVKSRKQDGGLKVLTVFLSIERLNKLLAKELETTQPVGYAYPLEGKGLTLFVRTDAEGKLVRAKGGLLGFNLRAAQDKLISG